VKIPPQNIKAEQSTLGSMMIEKTALHNGLEVLRAEDFYRPVHQEIFACLAALAVRDEPCDLITLQEELRKHGKLDDCGGTEYLMALAESVPTAANVKHYAEIVKTASLRRRVIAAGTEIIAAAQDTENEITAVTDLLTSKALELTDTRAAELIPGDEVVNRAWKRLESYEQGKAKRGVSWGLPHLDSLSYGVCDGDFIVIGGRPSHGKSILAAQIATHAVLSEHVPVIYSQEMSAEDFGERILFAKARVNAGMARSGKIESDEWSRLAEAAGRLYEGKWFIRDFPATEAQIVASAKRAQLQHKADMVIVDYIQLVKCSVRRENRNLELTHICDALQRLSRDTRMSVIACAQLSRASAKRSDKRPILEDLRESGSLEQNADKVILIHNPEYATPQLFNDGGLARCRALLDLAKHRNGPTGKVIVWCTPAATRFDPCDDAQWVEPVTAERTARSEW